MSLQPSATRAGLALACWGLVFSTGCGLFREAPPVTSPPAKAPPAAVLEAAPTAAPTPERRVGDFFVHRFSGSFAADPLTLTEEVVAREEQGWVVDFALSQNDQVERLRVRFDAATGEPRSAARFDGSSEAPAKLADYEALLARTIYAADVNDGLVSKSDQTCLIGSDELDCETKTYKVWVGDAPATLSVVHAKSLADRDVSGEITTEDGRLIYRAELLEARQGKPAAGVASR
jgi:hypothetical protein